jgi:hypothetical protein
MKNNKLERICDALEILSKELRCNPKTIAELLEGHILSEKEVGEIFEYFNINREYETVSGETKKVKDFYSGGLNFDTMFGKDRPKKV